MNINWLDSFEKTVKEKAKEIAVVHNSEQIEFADLQMEAKKLAMLIIERTDNAINQPIAVFLPKEINTIVADLGIMYSCNPFMNLDIKTPKERIKNILELVSPCAIVTSSKYIEKLEDLDFPILLTDHMGLETEFQDDLLTKRRKVLVDTDPLCIINTSGSTGTPKGVVLNHRSFFDFLDWAVERFKFDGKEVIGSLSPVVFDIFDFELCMMMQKGAKLVLLDASLAMFPVRLIEMLNANKVNFIFWVPSIMVNIANMDLLDKISIPSLKMVWFAGEVFPTKQFLYWYDKFEDALFVNLYGPIEITLDCTYYVVEERPEESQPLPIGVPCRNTDILILNSNDCTCGLEEEGELCVRGTSLAMGYYNNFEKTAKAFTQNPLNQCYPEIIYRTGDMVCMRKDGNIMFKGRKDSLIKHMGYRIELGEIEHMLENDIKIVKYCCAVYQYAQKKIVLFYESDQDITERDFRIALGNVFPAYMIPAVFCKVDMLPRNTNGKIDRLLLNQKVNMEPIELNEKDKNAGGGVSGKLTCILLLLFSLKSELQKSGSSDRNKEKRRMKTCVRQYYHI